MLSWGCTGELVCVCVHIEKHGSVNLRIALEQVLSLQRRRDTQDMSAVL